MGTVNCPSCGKGNNPPSPKIKKMNCKYCGVPIDVAGATSIPKKEDSSSPVPPAAETSKQQEEPKSDERSKYDVW